MIGAFSSLLHRLVTWRVVCWWLGLGGLLNLAGCASHLPYPPSPPQYETQFRATYRLAAGDRVRFISWSVPELSREMQVGADGTFVYPEVGTVQASGRTVVQLETELGQRLAADLGQLDPHCA